MALEHNLTIEIVYLDEQLLELETSFVTQGWSARATAYASIEEFSEFTKRLARFDATLSEEIQFTAGAETGIGYLAIRFYPIDSLGHIGCHVTLASSTATNHRPEQVWKVVIELRTEPAALDDFVKALIQMAKSRKGSATLNIE